MNFFSRIKLLLELQAALGRFQTAWQKHNKEIRMLTLAQTFKSKTFWVNALAAVAAGYQAIEGTLPPAVTGVVAAALPLVNIILKVFFTKQVPQ